MDGEERDDHLSPEFYEGVGRVIVGASSLEFMLGLLAEGLAPDPERDWMTLLSTPGGAIGALRRITSQVPRGAASPLRDLLSDAREALEERHKITHSLHLVVWADDMGTTRTGSLHVRGRAWEDVPTPGGLAQLSSRLRELGRRAGEMIPNTLTVAPGPDGRLRVVQD